MPRLQSIIVLSIAVVLTIVQPLCLCGPVTIPSWSASPDVVAARASETEHRADSAMPCHQASSTPESEDPAASSAESFHNTDECAHCSKSTALAAAHGEAATAIGTGFSFPKLLLLTAYAHSHDASPTIARSHWPPPEPAKRSPNTLVAQNILLLI